MQAVCLASGPSLTQEDVETVRQWRGEGRRVYVANTTFKMAPWADALFAMDGKWWQFHYVQTAEFHGRRFTTAALPATMAGVEKVSITNYRNSGANCVSLAVSQGATEVVLLGFDCMLDGTQTHWHGSHPAGMSDARTVNVWPVLFDRLAADMKRNGVKVVNASRRTALKCFERGELAEVLRA